MSRRRTLAGRKRPRAGLLAASAVTVFLLALSGLAASAQPLELAPAGECAQPRRDPVSGPQIAPIDHLAPLPSVAAHPLAPPPPPPPDNPIRDPCSDPGACSAAEASMLTGEESVPTGEVPIPGR